MYAVMVVWDVMSAHVLLCA